MKPYTTLPLITLVLIFSGCTNSTNNSITVSSQKLTLSCDGKLWNCPDRKDESIKITPKAGGESNLIMEKTTSDKSLEDFFAEKKSEVYKYNGNELIEEGDIRNGKFFINKNTYSNNYLFRAIKSISDNEYVICSGYSPSKTFESVKEDYKNMCGEVEAK